MIRHPDRSEARRFELRGSVLGSVLGALCLGLFLVLSAAHAEEKEGTQEPSCEDPFATVQYTYESGQSDWFCKCVDGYEDWDGTNDKESKCQPDGVFEECRAAGGTPHADIGWYDCLIQDPEWPGRPLHILSCKSLAYNISACYSEVTESTAVCQRLPDREGGWRDQCVDVGSLDFSALRNFSSLAEVADHIEPKLALTGFFPELHFSRKKTGDFDGDGNADLVAFLHDDAAGEGARRGDAYVALSNGSDAFEAPTLWAGWTCAYASNVCLVGDFNGDGRDDVARLGNNGYVYVHLSNGVAFVGSADYLWTVDADYPRGGARVADMNGDGLDDLVFFRQGSGTNASDGDVAVLLSNGVDGFAPQTTGGSFSGCAATMQGCNQPLVEHPIWHGSLCYDGEECFAGDLDGDGHGDLVAIRPGQNDVLWADCRYDSALRRRVCQAAAPVAFPSSLFLVYDLFDVDGNGQDDLVGYTSRGTVEYGVNLGWQDGNLTVTRVPTTHFECKNYVSCPLDDFDGDGDPDLIDITALSGWGVLGEVYVQKNPQQIFDELVRSVLDGRADFVVAPAWRTLRVGESTTVAIDIDVVGELLWVEGSFDFVGADAVALAVQPAPDEVPDFPNSAFLDADGLRTETHHETTMTGREIERVATLTVTGLAPGTFAIRTASDAVAHYERCENEQTGLECYARTLVIPEPHTIATIVVEPAAAPPPPACGIGPELALALPLLGALRRRRYRHA